MERRTSACARHAKWEGKSNSVRAREIEKKRENTKEAVLCE
jgi:hypothetical protein